MSDKPAEIGDLVLMQNKEVFRVKKIEFRRNASGLGDPHWMFTVRGRAAGSWLTADKIDKVLERAGEKQ